MPKAGSCQVGTALQFGGYALRTMAEGEAEPEAAAPEAAAPEEPNEPAGSGSEEEGPAPEPEPTPEEKGGWLLEAAKAGNKEETSRLVLDSEAGEFMQHTDRHMPGMDPAALIIL